MTERDHQTMSTARDYVARFGELALFRIEDEINKAVVRHRGDEVRRWLKVRAQTLSLLSVQERCLAFGHRPRHEIAT